MGGLVDGEAADAIVNRSSFVGHLNRPRLGHTRRQGGLVDREGADAIVNDSSFVGHLDRPSGLALVAIMP